MLVIPAGLSYGARMPSVRQCEGCVWHWRVMMYRKTSLSFLVMGLCGTLTLACSDSASSSGDDGGVVVDTGPQTPDAGPAAAPWAGRYGSAGNEIGLAVAVDDSGNLYVTGTFSGDLDLGKGQKTSAGSDDVFVASYDNKGALRWFTPIGGSGTDKGNDIAVDNKGKVFVTGQFRDTVDFGSGPVKAEGDSDIFVVGLDAASGAISWSHTYGGNTNDYGLGVATDGNGGVYVVGEFNKTLTAGSATLTSNGGLDVFLAKFADDGTLAWAKGFGGDDDDRGFGIAVDASGNSYITGYYFGNAELGGTKQKNRGGADAFVASYDKDGTHRWSTSFGGTQNDRGVRAEVHGETLYVTGRAIGPVDFGAGPVAGGSSHDAHLVSLKAADGSINWGKLFGDSGNDFGMGLAVDGAGNVYLAGSFNGTVDFGAGALTSKGQGDVMAVAFKPDGTAIWSKRFGGASNDLGNDIAVTPNGNVCLTGYVEGDADVGDDSKPGFGKKDLFLIQLKP
mgnify:CR=1 FL=1